MRRKLSVQLSPSLWLYRCRSSAPTVTSRWRAPTRRQWHWGWKPRRTHCAAANTMFFISWCSPTVVCSTHVHTAASVEEEDWRVQWMTFHPHRGESNEMTRNEPMGGERMDDWRGCNGRRSSFSFAPSSMEPFFFIESLTNLHKSYPNGFPFSWLSRKIGLAGCVQSKEFLLSNFRIR